MISSESNQPQGLTSPRPSGCGSPWFQNYPERGGCDGQTYARPAHRRDERIGLHGGIDAGGNGGARSVRCLARPPTITGSCPPRPPPTEPPLPPPHDVLGC